MFWPLQSEDALRSANEYNNKNKLCHKNYKPS